MEKYHPLWRIGGNVTMLSIFLIATSSNFDVTELRTLFLFLLGNSAVERFIK